MEAAKTAKGFWVLIPARRKASRLPDKPLLDLGGRPMIVRVAERAALSGASRVLVAADDPEIVSVCQAHGVEALLTRSDHLSGTDRLSEAAELLGLEDDTIVVNLQGDEPLVPSALLEQCAAALERAQDCSMATACHPISTPEELQNPNVVKVVLDKASRALYFSRAPIPHQRDDAAQPEGLPMALGLRHIGLYAYRAGFLRLYPLLTPAPLEHAEKLEQLRALWHGYRIVVIETGDAPEAGVDTPADLARVRAYFESTRPQSGQGPR
ncbi:MAG: 3-deoxy-manno-octulosonate cytidylyltransferase [Burkholderiaceae bacterium]|jgi:3-deoxy-manno-octulosonate cytidylyltransferase (CMP-KDO synthetase)